MGRDTQRTHAVIVQISHRLDIYSPLLLAIFNPQFYSRIELGYYQTQISLPFSLYQMVLCSCKSGDFHILEEDINHPSSKRLLDKGTNFSKSQI